MKSILFLVFVMYSVQGEILSRIPTHLIECYRSGGPSLNAPRRLDVFLSLLRRLELSLRLNMRMFSASLLRRFRLDGIEQASNPVETEYVLPYRASAFQFHKYKLLMDLFLPSQNLLEMVDDLSPVERCLMHKMLSSTVQPWERGDENLSCPVSTEQRQNMDTNSSSRIYSRCPIEDGVIQTDWGPMSPGTMVAAITAALEKQRVSINEIFSANVFKSEVSQPLIELAMDDWKRKAADGHLDTNSERLTDDEQIDVSNVLAATLVGDLAEVVVNQGPRVGASSRRMMIGSNNSWNDTLVPRNFYLFPQNSNIIDWHFTDAEIIAGIDGLILSNYIPAWIEQRRSLRLSQLIDMYYSNEGVSFDPNVRACNRLALYTNVIERSALLLETLRFANILSLTQITVYIPLEEMQRMTEAALDAFMEYVPSVIQRYHRNCEKSNSIPEMNLIVATDSAWKGFDVEQFMSWISYALELDAQKSTIALLHGNTGQWIAPPSDNVTSLFAHIANFTDEWPNRLNLPNVITKVNNHLRNQTLKDISDEISAGLNTVVLVLSPSDQPSGNELERSRELMHSLRSTHFDAYFVYAAQDLTNYMNVNNEYLDYSELFITLPSTSLKDVMAGIDKNFVKNEIPKKVVGVQCAVNGTVYNQVLYEDSILPGRKQLYRIHPFYLRQQSRIQVQFRNEDHGKILVCMWRGTATSHGCQTINERDVYTFNLSTPCPSPDFCPPANFEVSTHTSSLNTCTHTECRLPNQVGFYFRHSGLRCLPLLGAGVALKPFWKVYLGLSLLISIMYIF